MICDFLLLVEELAADCASKVHSNKRRQCYSITVLWQLIIWERSPWPAMRPAACYGSAFAHGKQGRFSYRTKNSTRFWSGLPLSVFAFQLALADRYRVQVRQECVEQ